MFHQRGRLPSQPAVHRIDFGPVSDESLGVLHGGGFLVRRELSIGAMVDITILCINTVSECRPCPP